MAETLKVEGFAELARSLRFFGGQASDGLRDELVKVGGIVADEARRIAERQGLRASGNLIGGIRARAVAAGIVVEDTASRRGFPYPALYEYGGAETRGAGHRVRNRSRAGVRLIAKHGLGTGGHGVRAFLHPARDAKEHEIETGVERMLDRLITANFGGST